MLALAAAITAPDWTGVGVSRSGLRVFVDRASISNARGLRRVVVRLGSPGAIVGRIVKITLDEELDCPGRRWRMLGYHGYDDKDGVVSEHASAGPAPALLPIEAGSITEAVWDEICSRAPLNTPQRQ